MPKDRVKVVVKNGWITLEGEVDWQYQKDAAFDAVHHLVGVRGVTNLIALKPRVIGGRHQVSDRSGLPAQRRGGCAEGPGGDARCQGDLAWRCALLVRARRRGADGLGGTRVALVENLIAVVA